MDADKRRLASVAKEHGVRCAAVGLPRAPDGLDCAPLRAFVKRYAHAALRGSSIGAVAFVDESFSTLEAASNVSLKSKASLRRDPVRMKQAIDSVRSVTALFFFQGFILFDVALSLLQT